jgi:choline dehydrogenase-like flavoprotein
VLGGSSAIYQNKITYNSPGGWDAWSALGNPSWNWKFMLPYIRKFHTFHPPSATTKSEILDFSNVDEVLEGDDGPIQTGFSDEGSWSDVDIGFYKAFKTIKAELGWNETMGGSASPNSIDPKTRTRSFAVTGYLGPEVRKRENLKVVTEALVQRIILEKNGDNVIASGVQFSLPSGEEMTIKAKKEVILCAGAFHSPAILELSGIGNHEILEKYGIEVITDNPNVGENLQDHAMCAVSFEAADGVKTADGMFRDPSIFPALLEMYQKDRSGPLGVFCTVSSYTPSSLFDSSASDELTAILSASPKDPKNENFEKELINLLKSKDGAACHNFLAKMQFHIADGETISEIRCSDALSKERNFITLFASQNHPFSKGNVHITSPSTNDKPAVDPKYLSHPLDMEMMARNVQFLQSVENI